MIFGKITSGACCGGTVPKVLGSLSQGLEQPSQAFMASSALKTFGSLSTGLEQVPRVSAASSVPKVFSSLSTGLEQSTGGILQNAPSHVTAASMMAFGQHKPLLSATLNKTGTNNVMDILRRGR